MKSLCSNLFGYLYTALQANLSRSVCTNLSATLNGSIYYEVNNMLYVSICIPLHDTSWESENETASL